MIEKIETEAVCAKIPVEYAQRLRDYAKASGKCMYEILQEILIKEIKEL